MPVRRVRAAALLCSTVACYSVSPVREPSQYIEAKRPDIVWVADTAGEVIRMAGPTIHGDSVVGTLDGVGDPIAVQLTDNHAVFARQKSTRKTVELVGAIGVISGLAVYGIVKAQGGPEDCTSLGSNPTGRPYC